MELNTIVEALRATTVVGSQKDAVAYLDETSKMIGFLPLLTQIAMNEELEVPVRQAAIIFFKNGVSRAWIIEEGEENITPISEQDKHIIRREILNHILNATLPIRVHLCTAIQNILRHDYPREWPDFPGSIAAMLHVDNFNSWLCALQVTHRLTKLYEYKRQQEKQPLLDFMTSVLPLIYVRMESCVNANLMETAPLEHMVLKVFYTLTQFSMSTEIITVEVFGKWIELLIRIIDRPIPEAVNEFPEDERSEQYPWKCKKWAMKIIQKLFDRYGAKGQVEKTYSEYAQYYFDHYAIRVIQSLMRILQDFHQHLYVPDRYLYFALTHLADSLSHAEIWMVVKPHFNELVFHIIFPLLCYSEDDEELWESEEIDFVKQRHDCFDELHSPYAAAANVLVAGLKRKGVLDNLLQHFVQLLQNPETSDRDADGALHVISNMMAKLASSRKYKKDVEKLIALHITPRLTHANRFVRLHACYCLRMADEVSFKTERILKEAIQALVERIRDPNELLAIKIEAGVALNDLLEGQKEKAEKYFKVYVRDVLTELFRLLNRINLDELTTIADSIIENFPDEVIPVAIDIANEIHSLFVRFANINGEANDGDFDDNSITVIGLLSTLQTLLDLVDDSPEISSRLEPIVFDVIRLIYESESVDFYEDTVTLVESLITKSISPKAWEFYPMIRKHFDVKGEINNLTMTEYMGCLYSYLVVGTDEFLRVPERANMMIEMCDATLKNFDIGADPHLNAAKLLECFILQCRGRIDEYIPHILQITMNRLQAGHFENTDNQLVPQLLVVLIAAMYYNFNLFVQCLPKLTPFGMETVQWIFTEIFANKEFIEGIHNRKMVIYAICLMLRLPREHQPPAIATRSKEVMEFCLDLFEGIERCLKAIAERKKEEESSDEEDSDDDDMNRTVDDELRDSDDDIDEGTLEYLEQLNKSEQRESRKREANAMNPADAILENIRSDSEDSELYETFNEETDVESYVTPLDHEEDGLNVYIDFKQCLENLQNNNRTQFDELTSVDGKMAEALKKLFDYCVQQENLVNSRMVSKAGGYKFTDAKVPSSFNFSK